MNLLNPYSYIGAAVVLAALVGSYSFMDNQIHHYHVAYDNEHAARLQDENKILAMTVAQDAQTKASGEAVIKVIQGPKEVQTIIDKVNGTPAKPCTVPDYSEEIKNAY